MDDPEAYEIRTEEKIIEMLMSKGIDPIVWTFWSVSRSIDFLKKKNWG